MVPLALDRSQPHHGQFSARWLIEPELETARLVIPLPAADAAPGRTYCVSVALRANVPQTVEATLSDAEPGASDAWRVERKWRVYSRAFRMSARPVGGAPTLVLAVRGTREPRVVWLDAIKVELGASPTPYRPADSPAITAGFSRPSRLFFEREPVRIVVGARYASAVSSEVTLRWTLRGRGAVGEHGRVSLASPITRDVTIYAKVLPRGWHRCELELRDGGGRRLARRAETFAVVRNLSDRPKAGFELVVPSRGPRHDTLAGWIGLAVDRAGPTSRPTRPTTTRRVRPPASRRDSFGASRGIRALTAMLADGIRSADWPTAWDELLDADGRWRAVTVAVNVWLDLFGSASHLRTFELAAGTVVVDVFNGASRDVAVVSTAAERASERAGIGRVVSLDVPLPARHLAVMDVYGAVLPVTSGADRMVVDLSAGPVYVVAGPNLTRGRFALQLERSRVIATTTRRAPTHDGR